MSTDDPHTYEWPGLYSDFAASSTVAGSDRRRSPGRNSLQTAVGGSAGCCSPGYDSADAVGLKERVNKEGGGGVVIEG
jgi:hypothetical protein